MSQSEQAQFWNTDSAQWRKQEEGAQPLYTKMIACMETKSGQSILDIGCGTGYFLSLFDKKQVVCHGIDLSESQLNYARTHLPQMEWKQASMDAIPYADHSFDWVSCNNALQFVPDPRLALTEFKRVMKNDAQLIIAVWDQPDRNDALLYFNALARFSGRDATTAIPFNLSAPQQMERLVVANGFELLMQDTVRYTRSIPNVPTALKALLSSGPAREAIQLAGYDAVAHDVAEAIQPFLQNDGSLRMQYAFRFLKVKKG